MTFHLSSKQIESYYSKLIDLFGYEYKPAKIKLVDDYKLNTDIKTKYICGNKEIVLAYNPKNLIRLANDLKVNTHNLFVIGFAESLSYAVQQYFLHTSCLNNCKHCRLNIKAKKFRYLNTLITYKCMYELFPEKKYTHILDRILQTTCGKRFSSIKKKILNVDLRKPDIEHATLKFSNNKYANFIFHLYKKYELLPESFAINYIVEKPAEESLNLFSSHKKKINSIFISSDNDKECIYKLKKINKRISKEINTLYKEFDYFYNAELKQINQKFIDKMKKVDWQFLLHELTKIRSLKLTCIKELKIYPCATLMGSGFLKRNCIYCSPTNTNDGGIIHEMIHKAIHDRPAISNLNIAKWQKLIKGTSYTILDYVEQGYVFLIECFIKDKYKPLKIKNKEKFFRENGFLEIYKIFRAYKPNYYNLDLKKYAKIVENAI